MSIVYRCNRCGKEIEGNLPKFMRIRKIFFTIEWHFCWDCYHEVMRFASGEKTKEGK